MAQMVLDKRADEPVAVIVALAPAELERLAGGGAGLDEELGAELLREELIVRALIDEQGAGKLPARHQLAGIPLGPGGAIRAQVAAKGLLAPGHAARRRDGRERRDAAIAIRVAQPQHQCAVAAHRMAE